MVDEVPQCIQVSRKMPMVKEELKAEWLKKRAIGFGMIIAGTIITVIGCYI